MTLPVAKLTTDRKSLSRTIRFIEFSCFSEIFCTLAPPLAFSGHDQHLKIEVSRTSFIPSHS